MEEGIGGGMWGLISASALRLPRRSLLRLLVQGSQLSTAIQQLSNLYIQPMSPPDHTQISLHVGSFAAFAALTHSHLVKPLSPLSQNPTSPHLPLPSIQPYTGGRLRNRNHYCTLNSFNFDLNANEVENEIAAYLARCGVSL